MNKYKLPVALLLLVCHSAFSQSGRVVIQVSGVDMNKGGELSAAFFSKGNFPKMGKQSFGDTKKVSSETMQLVFQDVPAGEYGIAVFQDIDRNKDLKKNLIGIPMEPLGFSNGARIKFGLPSFDDAKVVVEKGKTLNVTVKLR